MLACALTQFGGADELTPTRFAAPLERPRPTSVESHASALNCLAPKPQLFFRRVKGLVLACGDPQDGLAALADELWPTKDVPCE